MHRRSLLALAASSLALMSLATLSLGITVARADVGSSCMLSVP